MMLRAVRLLKNVHRGPEILSARRQTDAWIPLTRRYLGLGNGMYPYEVTLRDGARIRLETIEEVKVFWNVFCRESYHVDPSDRVILDAGGNIGLFAIWASRAAPRARIVSFEPWPSTFQRLTRHITMNGLNDRVTAVNVALAGECGERDLVGSDDDSCNNRLQVDRARSQTQVPTHPTVVATCRTLEATLDDFKLPRVDLLKMDIEGGEYETLLATPPAVLRRIRRINLEYHEVAAHLRYSKAGLFAHLAEGGHVLLGAVEHEFTGVAQFEWRTP
jgi:FkbM family methyltransferase